MLRHIFLIMLLFLFVSCSQSEKSTEEGKSSSRVMDQKNEELAGLQMTTEKAKAPVSKTRPQADKMTGKKDNDSDLEGKQMNALAGMLDKSSHSSGRYLEYRIYVQLKSDDLFESRQTLFDLIEKYGYVRKSNISYRKPGTRMHLEFSVRVNSMHEALRNISKAGELVSETVSVVDHTESMFQTQLYQKREIERILRRTKRGQTLDKKSWVDLERLLAQSEDRKDSSDINEWRIKDKVSWATLTVSVEPKKQSYQIVWPNFQRAWMGAVEILVYIPYLVLFFSPIWIIIGLIIWQRKRIKSWFSRKPKEQ